MTREEMEEAVLALKISAPIMALKQEEFDAYIQKINTVIDWLEQESCEMTVEEYRQRMIQAFHNADCDGLIAVCVLPTEKEFKHLEWLLKNHYKEPCEDRHDALSDEMTLDEEITHCEEVAIKNEETIAHYTIQGDKEWLDECEKDCIEDAKKHRQFAAWLKELKQLREQRWRDGDDNSRED